MTKRRLGRSAIRALSCLLACGLAAAASAQEPGWHYSPLAGEGDRAAMGCAAGSDTTHYTCLAVRCEDDFSVGLHVHTSRAGSDAGAWSLDVDKESFEIEAAAAGGSPYGARVAGDVATLLDRLRHGFIAYLDPAAGAPVERNGITLAGSLYAINQALYFCAPPAEAAPEPAAHKFRRSDSRRPPAGRRR